MPYQPLLIYSPTPIAYAVLLVGCLSSTISQDVEFPVCDAFLLINGPPFSCIGFRWLHNSL